MAALTASYDPHPKDGELVAYPVAANTTIYKGGLVNISGGYAVPAADAAIREGGQVTPRSPLGRRGSGSGRLRCKPSFYRCKVSRAGLQPLTKPGSLGYHIGAPFIIRTASSSA